MDRLCSHCPEVLGEHSATAEVMGFHPDPDRPDHGTDLLPSWVCDNPDARAAVARDLNECGAVWWFEGPTEICEVFQHGTPVPAGWPTDY